MSLKRKFHNALMGTDELRVMLQGVFTTRSDNYSPRNLFRSPIQAARWWSHLNDNKRYYDDKYFMVCIPIRQYEMNFFSSFRRHYLEMSESSYVQDQIPMTAGTYGGIQVYSIKNVYDLRLFPSARLGTTAGSSAHNATPWTSLRTPSGGTDYPTRAR